MVSGIGMLGAMLWLGAGDHDAMCLNLDNEVLAVGDIRHAVSPPNKSGRCAYTALYDVRSFLCIGEMDDHDKRLVQGTAAVHAINAWADDNFDGAEKFVSRIPLLAQERETYTALTAKKFGEMVE